MKGSAARALGTPDERKLGDTEDGRKALELKGRLDEVKALLRDGVPAEVTQACGFTRLKPRSVFQFFRAAGEGNTIHLFEPAGEPVVQLRAPAAGARLEGCAWRTSLHPLKNGQPVDHLALFVTTAGEGIRELAEHFKAKGDFLKMHAVQALALETAEAYAELLHSQLRSMWGFPDRPDLTMLERFRAEYQGKRYSFGYPACPRLEDQEKLFQALKPEDIGVQADRRLHDGARGLGLGARVPPPGGVLLLGDVGRAFAAHRASHSSKRASASGTSRRPKPRRK